MPEQPPARIRPATHDDLDALVDVTWAVAAEGRWIGAEVPFDRDGRRAALAAAIDDGAATLLVADAGRPAGVVGHLSLRLAPYGVADLGMLLVEGWRGRGLGTALLGAGIGWAREAGAHKVWLEVWPSNTGAIALYRRAGFVEEGRKVRHYRRRSGELWDAVLMGLQL